MKSYWIKAAGNGTELEERDVPVPVPDAGQLLVRVRAAGLNRGELITRGDLHGGAAARPAGTESAGEVERVGADVTDFAPGDRVMATGRGSFAAQSTAFRSNFQWSTDSTSQNTRSMSQGK